MNDFYSSNSLYGSYRTRKFSDIYPIVDTFIKDFNSCGIPTMITEQNAKTLYYLLLGKYANSHIASTDEHTFTLRLFTIVFSAGPVWEQKLQIQQRLKDLNDDELFTAVQSIYNRAQNPNEETKTDTILDYITSQDVNKQKRGKLETLMEYYDAFKNCTDAFLDKFRSLFKVIVIPDDSLLYVESEEPKDE